MDWDLEANAQRRRAPLTIFWLDRHSGSRRQGVLGRRKIPGRRLTQSTPFPKRVGIRGSGGRKGNDDGEGDGETQETLGKASNRCVLFIKKPLRVAHYTTWRLGLPSASAHNNHRTN